MTNAISDIVRDSRGVPVTDALVYVYSPQGGLATLYNDLGSPIENPIATNDNGLFEGYSTEDGYHKLAVHYGGRERYVQEVLLGTDAIARVEAAASILAVADGGRWATSLTPPGDVPSGDSFLASFDGRAILAENDAGTGVIRHEFMTASTLAGQDGGGIGYSYSVSYGANTVGGKLRQMPSIKDKGAAGDGTTNDTVAENQARATLRAAGGGTLFYPPGQYLINGRKRSAGLLIEEPDFPAFAGLEPNISFGVYTRNNGEGDVGKAGVYSFMVNGTGNMVPFSTVGGRDCVPVSAVVYSGEDAPNPVCALNVISRYAGLPPGINWGVEIDMNNESPEPYSSGDPRGGQALVINTGSTYSPDAGIVIQRGAGEGTGPGYKQGVAVKGARDVAFYAQAMTEATAPGMSPPATGGLAVLVSNVGGEPFNRFTMIENGAMYWSSGSAAQDVGLFRSAPGALDCTAAFGAQQFFCQGLAVVGPRRPAIANAGGGTEIATINAVLSALRTHGLIAT